MKNSNHEDLIMSALNNYSKKEFSNAQKEKICRISKSERIDFSLMEKIDVLGCGGNGVVFKINEKTGREYCLKVLYDEEGNKKKRFCNEIKALNEIVEYGIDGIVPALFNGLNEGMDYFAMNCYHKYNVNCNRSFRQRIIDLISIANTIKTINENTSLEAHRDIKLSNILVKDDKIYLSDFGLVKFKNLDENITVDDFRIGPLIISPIEFYKTIPNWDYHISDVYLFSKLVWQVLKKSRSGFWGEYTGDLDNLLHIDIIKEMYKSELIGTIEPINEMIINTTSNNLLNRKKYRIDYCIKCLNEELQFVGQEQKNNEVLDFNQRKECTNSLMFFPSGTYKVITLGDTKVAEILAETMNNREVHKSLSHIRIMNGKPMDINVNDFECTNDIMKITDLYNTLFYGKVRFVLVNNEKKEIVIDSKKSNMKITKE